MGLLERMMEKLEKIEARLDAQEGKPVTVTIENKTEATLVTEKTESGATVTTVELDKNGIPWDERIHAGTKRKNADGTWSLKKGVDKDLATKIIAEYQAAAPKTPAVPAPPAKSGVPTPLTPPAKPGVPKAPEAAGPTVQAARLSNVLINDMGVDYDLVIEGVLKPRNYDQFGSVTMTEAEEVLKALEVWKAKLTDLNEEFDGIRKMAEGTEHIGTINDGLVAFVTNHGGEGDDPATVPFAKLHELFTGVCDWANQWEPVLKG